MPKQGDEARRYHRRQLAVAVADFVVTIAVLVAWIVTGAARELHAALAARGASAPLTVAALALAVGGSRAALTFPLDVVGGHLLPRHAGLSTQRFGAWLGDRAKLLAIGGGLGLLAVEALYALLRSRPERWWLWGAAVLGGGGVLVAAALPIWLLPLFYRLAPLSDDALRARLLAVAGRVGVRAAEVLVADFSRKGRTANAAVIGLGRTRRILVSDTLLDRFPPAEVDVVLAHELAHHARWHLAQGLAVQGVLLLAVLGLADRVLRAGVPALGLAGPADPAGLPLLALALTGFGLLVTPPAAAWSRRLEREADRVALEVTRDPAAFVGAMERLGRLNLAERQPSRWKEWLFATHPSIESRIRTARAAADRLAAVP